MSDKPDEQPPEEGNDNAGNQYDNPNQEVVGTDIISGAGNEVPEADEDERDERDDRDEEQEPESD